MDNTRERLRAEDNPGLISIIIPVYNVESYLRECLDSVVSQTYPNIEIILSDDGSKDSSGGICDEYARQDARIIVIHKANGGAASARNAALDVASGSWIMFVDSDDIIARDTCESLMAVAREKNADITGGCEMRFYGSAPDTSRQGSGSIECFDSKETLLRIFYMCAQGHTVCKLFKRSVIGDLRFPEGVAIGEDTHLLLRALDRAGRIAEVDYVLYFYRQIETSAIHSRYSPKMMAILDVLAEAKRTIGSRSGELDRAIDASRFFNAASLLGVMNGSREFGDDRARLIREIRETGGPVLRDSRNTRKVRVMALVSIISPRLLGFMMSRWNAIRKKLKVN